MNPISPTLQQVKDAAHQQGLTDADAEECYAHYAMQGWIRSNGMPVVNLEAAVMTWRLNKPKHSKQQPKNWMDNYDAK